MTTDHLGTPRFYTNASGVKVGAHVYDPFGLELTSPVQNTSKMKLTGHERDAWQSASGQGDDLDYMHARFFNPTVGRFLSVDPVGGNPFAPQSWNRYSYVLGNPMKYIDPWGLTAKLNTTTTARPGAIRLMSTGTVSCGRTGGDSVATGPAAETTQGLRRTG